MSNEEMTKLIVALGALGYQVVAIKPEMAPASPPPGEYATGKTILLISPKN